MIIAELQPLQIPESFWTHDIHDSHLYDLYLSGHIELSRENMGILAVREVFSLTTKQSSHEIHGVFDGPMLGAFDGLEQEDLKLLGSIGMSTAAPQSAFDDAREWISNYNGIQIAGGVIFTQEYEDFRVGNLILRRAK